MNFSDLSSLAMRGLMRRPVRTILTIVGIVVAVASMVVFLSLGEGFRRALSNEIGNIGPDIQVGLDGSETSSIFGSPIPDVPLATVGKFEALKNELGIKQVIPLLLTARGNFSGSGYVIVAYPFDQVKLTDVYPNIKLREGDWIAPNQAKDKVAVVGSQAAKTANLKLGDELRLSRADRYRVIGIAEKTGGFTDSAVFLPFASLQKTLAVEDKATLIALKLNDAADARKTADIINERFKGELKAQTQGDVVQVLDRAVAIGDAFRFGISLIALIVGGLAVANTVMMGVYERTKEFGVIRAIGAKPSFVFQLVVWESLLIALLGGLGGIIVGYIGTLIVNFAVRDLISVAIAQVTPRLVLLSVGIAMILGLLSGLLPARTASRLVITQALGRN
jgi:putative ABC transport system permease protein